MLLSDFDYHLPKSAIAQHPLKDRDQSKLLVVRRETGELEDKKFLELPEYLSAPDVLVVNNCKVIPARIFASRKTGGKIEVTLVEKISETVWHCLVKGKKPKPGEEIEIAKGAKIVFEKEMDMDAQAGFLGGLWQIKFSGASEKILEKVGVAPLPPYIKRSVPEDYKEDRTEYQTIFAQKPGAVAAPTAGFHFTRRVLDEIKESGVSMAEVTLYVSYGTFAPVRVERIEDHKMHFEKYSVDELAAEKINRARSIGGRVIAVGTTVARTLEAASDKDGKVSAKSDATDLFITPGYQFKSIDALLTNFHMPKSTLLMLVSAFVLSKTDRTSADRPSFAGLDLIQKAYSHALENNYRFLSYGDCMLIL